MADSSSSVSPASRVAIVGGGISGLSAAYELTRRGVPFELLEASAHWGGLIETVRHGDFIVECGPDSWVTEKPAATELAIELGLGDQVIASNDAVRRTYLARSTRSGAKLVAIPAGMRMMVATQWGPLLRSPLFGWGVRGWRAKLSYLREPLRAEELKAAVSNKMADESVAEFIRRHFGEEVSRTLAAPLLAGIFGGDIERLSAAAVLPGFLALARRKGSIVSSLRNTQPSKQAGSPLFSTFSGGVASLVPALVQALPPGSLRPGSPVEAVRFEEGFWKVRVAGVDRRFDALVLATPAPVTRDLLRSMGDAGRQMGALIPVESSSVIVVAMGYANPVGIHIPRGFGILFPSAGRGEEPSLAACTFLDQKFPHRAPAGAVLLRAFFGGASAEALLGEPDEAVVERARRQLGPVLSTRSSRAMPDPDFVLVRRWPHSLPQYLVGHDGRIAELSALMKQWPRLELIGNAYRGVGISDLIQAGRTAAERLTHFSR